MILETLPQVQALSAEQRQQLFDELWMEILDESKNEARDAAIEKLLEHRYQKYLENPSSAMSLEELRARHEANKRAWRESRK
jgi:putative addiction module component (TIGR02574 family)